MILTGTGKIVVICKRRTWGLRHTAFWGTEEGPEQPPEPLCAAAEHPVWVVPVDMPLPKNPQFCGH